MSGTHEHFCTAGYVQHEVLMHTCNIFYFHTRFKCFLYSLASFLPCMKCKREKEKRFFIKEICIWYSNSKTSGWNVLFHELIKKIYAKYFKTIFRVNQTLTHFPLRHAFNFVSIDMSILHIHMIVLLLYDTAVVSRNKLFAWNSRVCDTCGSNIVGVPGEDDTFFWPGHTRPASAQIASKGCMKPLPCVLVVMWSWLTVNRLDDKTTLEKILVPERPAVPGFPAAFVSES